MLPYQSLETVYCCLRYIHLKAISQFHGVQDNKDWLYV